MKLEMDINNKALLTEIDDLVLKISGKTEIACEAMANIIRPALISAAPYDNIHHGKKKDNGKEKHLKEVIKKSKVKICKGNKEITIWLNPRGIPGAKQGKNAKKNWDKEKQVYKLVIAEFGRSDLPAKPFWVKTVNANTSKALEAAVKKLKEGIEK
ncbi:MAG: hypothetical protein RR355_01790 [Oscillospiraceae bacterium]